MTGVFLIRTRSRPLIRKGLAVSLDRSVKPELKLGICGEHGGDPASIAFCHSQGLTDVSCSPFRVPLTRLAAAQAAIKASGHSLTQDK
ncbi:PEP-utilizing TIM barrel enzyme [Streptococcus pyogenes GA41394]|nr:PEP-utilizing TIM barrel enzyme [Streptococcus pyogenes GA41394]